MKSLGVMSMIAGLVAIAGRGPLIFWPTPTRDFYLKLLSSHTRIRVLGLGFAALGAALILTGRGHPEPAAVLMMVLGCLLAYVAGFVMLVMPSMVKLIGSSMLVAMDELMLRGLGVVSVAVGALLIWGGVYFYRL